MICVRPGFGPCDDHRESLAVRQLQGHLYVPQAAVGLVVLAEAPQPSGVRHVEQSLVAALRGEELATCQVGLLEASEAYDSRKVRDVGLLADRLAAVLDFLAGRSETARLPIALVGSQGSSAAALTLAARDPPHVRAVVCLAGRPHRAPIDPADVAVPTVLVVPDKHPPLMESHQRVFWALRCTSQLAIIRGASRRFTESGTLVACEKVVTEWCRRHLAGAGNACEAPEDRHYRPQIV